MANSNSDNDQRIEELHRAATQHVRQLEQLIDQLKRCGAHTRDSNNALANVRASLRDISNR